MGFFLPSPLLRFSSEGFSAACKGGGSPRPPTIAPRDPRQEAKSFWLGVWGSGGVVLNVPSSRLRLRATPISSLACSPLFSFEENGWGASIAHRLARKCDVLNRGLSGYNTRWAKIVLPRLVNKDSIAKTVAVTVFFGANDSALKDVNPKQHVPLDEYADNLRAMIQYLKSVDITEDKVVLVTPPPLHEASWEKECIAKGEKLNRLNSTTGEYAKACVKVAEECGTSFIDLWTLMQKNNQDFCCYLSDGLHLSAKGNNFLANQLWSLLEQKTSTLPMLLPYWRDVDHLNPEASLLGSPQD